MIIKIFSIILSICIMFNICIFTVNGENVPIDCSKENTDCINDETEDLSPISVMIQKNHYDVNEQINIKFNVSPNYIGTQYTYTTYGFNVIGSVDETMDKSFDITIKYNGLCSNPTLTFFLQTENGEVSASLYGNVNEDGLFLSPNSEEDAVRTSYAFKLNNSEITLNQYYAIMENYCWDKDIPRSVEGNLGDSIQSNVSGDSSYTTNVIPGGPILREGEFVINGVGIWHDDRGINHPLQYTKVALVNADDGQVLCTTYTDVNGNYTLIYETMTITMDIYVRAYTEDENCAVKDANRIIYTESSQIYTNVTRDIAHTINLSIDMDQASGQAFQIMQAIITMQNYAKEMNGSYLPEVEVEYPRTDNRKSTYYSIDNMENNYPGQNRPATIKLTNTKDIWGSVEPYAAWDNIMHEYGHHIQYYLNIAVTAYGSHFYGQNLVDSYGKDRAIDLAWSEAQATVWGAMAQDYYSNILGNIETVADGMYSSFTATILSYDIVAEQMGEAYEVTLIQLLWDLYDTGVGEYYDTLGFTHQPWWNLMANSSADNLSEFNYYYNSTQTFNKKSQFGILLTYYNVSSKITTCNDNGNTIFLQWDANGASSSLPNNRFDLIVYDSSSQILMTVNNIYTTSYTFTAAQRQQIYNAADGAVQVIVVAYQTDSPTTGGYYSQLAFMFD